MNKKACEVFVAIGSSAGGFEALSELVTNLPQKTGFFYFLAQHHARGEKTILAELLGRKSTIEVVLVQEGITFLPDVLYVLPPELKVIVHHNKPTIIPAEENLLSPLPNADFLFTQLSTIAHAKVIAILLSGSGNDGTKGMKLIKEANGITIAQTPEEAMFESMPRSAISTKLVDYILSVEEIGNKLAKIAFTIADGSYLKQEVPYDAIVKILYKEKQLDLFGYKEETIQRRIDKRMHILNLKTIHQYAKYIKLNAQEVDILTQEILIGVTEFFRGTEAFEALKNVMKEKLALLPEYSEFRMWSVACSSGEEPYSLAIVANEVLRELDKHLYIRIFASDLDDRALQKARQGEYKADILEHVPSELVGRYFEKVENGYKVVKSLRDIVVFAHHNFLNNPPFINMDLISCRNVFIYLKSSIQKEVFSLFHYALKSEGVLFLGLSESILSSSDYFATIDNKNRIYQKKEQQKESIFPIQVVSKHPKKLANTGKNAMQKLISPSVIEKHLQEDLFEYFSNESLIVDNDYNMVYKKGNIPYLGFSDGIASLIFLIILIQIYTTKQELF